MMHPSLRPRQPPPPLSMTRQPPPPLSMTAVVFALAQNQFKPVRIEAILGVYSWTEQDYEEAVRLYLLSSLHPQALVYYNRQTRSFAISYLPELCVHGSRCKNALCGRVHICKRFLLGCCSFGKDCSGYHAFRNGLNVDILVRNNLQDLSEMLLVALFLSKYRPRALRPKSCDFYSRDECEKVDCCYLHICRHYLISGDCERDRCKQSHDILDEHNRVIILQYNVNVSLPLEDIENLLLDWYDGEVPKPKPKFELCKFYGKSTCTKKGKCQFLHLCLYYLDHSCRYGRGRCQKSHDVLDGHNARILEKLNVEVRLGHQVVEELIRRESASMTSSVSQSSAECDAADDVDVDDQDDEDDEEDSDDDSEEEDEDDDDDDEDVIVESDELVIENSLLNIRIDSRTNKSDESNPVTSTLVLNGSTPVLNGSTPVLNGSTPVINGSTPVINGSTPVLNGSTPVINVSTSVITESTPVITESTPVINVSTPVINVSTPVINGSTPVINGSTPVINGSTPVTVAKVTDSPASLPRKPRQEQQQPDNDVATGEGDLWQYKLVDGSGWQSFPDTTCTEMEWSICDARKATVKVRVGGRRFQCNLDQVSRYGQDSCDGVVVRRTQRQTRWFWYIGFCADPDYPWKKIESYNGKDDLQLSIEDSYRSYLRNGSKLLQIQTDDGDTELNFAEWRAKIHGMFADLRRRPAFRGLQSGHVHQD